MRMQRRVRAGKIAVAQRTKGLAMLLPAGIGLILLIPGGLFGVGLGFWLIIKGFQPEAYARGFSAPVSASRPGPEPAAT